MISRPLLGYGKRIVAGQSLTICNDTMPQIEWNKSLELGVESLDNQHKRLIDLANKLLLAIPKSNYDELKKIVREFKEYAFYHFTDEEAYMEKIKYPKIVEHRHNHVELRTRVKQFQDRLYRHEIVSEPEFREFLKMWLIGHFLQKDMLIKAFSESREQQPAA